MSRPSHRILQRLIKVYDNAYVRDDDTEVARNTNMEEGCTSTKERSGGATIVPRSAFLQSKHRQNAMLCRTSEDPEGVDEEVTRRDRKLAESWVWPSTPC